MKRNFALFLLLVVLRPASARAQSGAQTPDFPQHGPYFFCDSRVVEDRWMVDRFVVQLAKDPRNPLIVKDKPWEQIGPLAGGSVLWDPQDGLFKLWYGIFDLDAYRNRTPFSYNICYAESEDGVHWRKPDLGLFDKRGQMSKHNNCVKLGREKTSGIDVEFNPYPHGRDDRFVAIHNDSGGVFVSTSGDGKLFHPDFSRPAVPYHSDTHNNFVYDEVRKRWLMFVRPQAFAGAGLKGVGRRRVAVKESRDLRTWTRERTVLTPNEDDPDNFYGMTVFRRGDLLFGALQLYETRHHHIREELVWSADGFTWERLPRSTHPIFLDVGPEGSWDDGMVFLMDRPVVVGDEMWFYYAGCDTPHTAFGDYGIGRAVTRLDRLVGLRARPDTLGRVLTRPLHVEGNLVLNASATGGEIRVSVHTAEDKVIPGWTAAECQPVRGDAVAAPVHWREHGLSELAGKTVRLRFHLRNATLYTFDFRPGGGR
ncbi:MAG TPA: exo-alpha-sialidase [Bacteroidetes bacterium]|nr:exo-alpha-sialidase [Bacteroidota bacterium]